MGSCALDKKHCVPCEGGVFALSQTAAATLLENVPTWTLSADAKVIHKHFEFKGFSKTMAFVNAVAWIAGREMHQPDVTFGYNYCKITYTTHAIDGLSENDFICAAKIDQLLV